MTDTDKIVDLLDKMTSSDPNVRSMATADLITQLKASQLNFFKQDEEIEKKIVKMFRRLLQDKMLEMQNETVNGFGLRALCVNHDQVVLIAETLCKNLSCENDQLCDISIIGLATVISFMPKPTPELSIVCDNIASKLTDVIRRKADVLVQLEVLDILSKLLVGSGTGLTKCHASIQESIQEVLLPVLESKQRKVRIRAIRILTDLLAVCDSEPFDSEPFDKIMNILLDWLNQQSSGDFALVSTYTQCISAFEVFEQLPHKAPGKITPYVSRIRKICLDYLCYADGDEDHEFENKTEMRKASAKCTVLFFSTRSCWLYKSGQADRPINLLKSKVPDIVRMLSNQLKKENVKTQKGWFRLLVELIKAVPNCLADHLDIVMPGILYSLTEKNTVRNAFEMKMDTLKLLSLLLKTYPTENFHMYLHNLIPAVIQTVDDSSYEICPEALAVLKQLIKVIPSPNSQFAKYIEPTFKCISNKLQASDPDKTLLVFHFEAMERSILCIGQLINTFGDAMQEHNLQEALSLLVELLNENERVELFRLASIEALILAAGSPSKINMAPFLDTVIPILAGFLSKNQTTLTINSLMLLDTLVKHHSVEIDSTVIETVLVELPPLINAADLHVSQLALTLLTSMINSGKADSPIITDKILEQTLVLVRSGLPQGSSLKSLLDFWIRGSVDLSSIPKLKELLISELDSQNLQLQAALALGLISIGNVNAFLPVVIDQIKQSERKQNLLLPSLKEIISCHLIDDTMSERLTPYLESIWELLIYKCQCSEENTRKAIAECLGKLIGWKPDDLLPRLQSYLENESNNALARSTVMTAMKFVISERPQPIDPQLKQRMNELLKTTENEEPLTFNAEELQWIREQKLYEVEFQQQNANCAAALDRMLGAVAAAPKLRQREGFTEDLNKLFTDLNTDVNTDMNSRAKELDRMIELALQKSIVDYGLTMAEIEENTKADDKAQEEDYNEQEKELIKELAELCKREEEKALRRPSLPEETKKEDTEKEETKKGDTEKEETEMEETEKGDTEMKETEEDDFVDLEKELKELKEGLSRRT